MCRSNNHGGRRCPYGSSYVAKQRANANRKKNRIAKKNLAAYFTAQGMDKTATAVKKMAPSAIPALLDQIGMDETVLGVSAPAAHNVSEDKRVDAEVMAALAEEKGDKELVAPETEAVAEEEPETVTTKKTTKKPATKKTAKKSVEEAPAEAAVEDPTEDFSTDYSAASKEVIDTAVEEASAQGKSTEELLDTSAMAAEVPAKTKEEIAVGFAQYIKGNKDSGHDGGIYKAENKENLTELYRQINDLDDVPAVDQRKAQNDYWQSFAQQANQAVSSLGATKKKVDKDVQQVMDGIDKAEAHSIPKKFMMKKSSAKLVDREALVGNTTMNGNLKVMLLKVADQEASLKDLGDNTYLVRTENQDAYILHAPNGLKDAKDMSLSQRLYYVPSALDGGTEIPAGLGLGTLSVKERKEALRGSNIWSYVNALSSQTYSTQQKAEVLLNKSSIKDSGTPKMTSKGVRDVRMAYNFIKGDTVYHKITGATPKGKDFEVEDLRNFHAGLVKHGEKVEVTKDVSKIFGKDEPYTADPRSNKSTFQDTAESKKFFASLNNTEVGESVSYSQKSKAAKHITDYTGGGYSQFALVATSTGNDGNYSDEDLVEVNEKIVEFSEKNVKKPRTVFRGQKPPYGMSAKEYIESLTPGESMAASKLLSTTSKASIATDFNGGQVIFCYRSKQGAALTNFSNFEREKEVIMPIGAEFAVVKTEMHNGRGIVYLADKDMV